MSALVPYLAPGLMHDIKNAAIIRAEEFAKQSGETKLALVNNKVLELELYREGVPHLLNVIDDLAAETEGKDNQINYYQHKYGVTNEDYVKSENCLAVVRSAEKAHAKKALQIYADKYEQDRKANKDAKNNK